MKKLFGTILIIAVVLIWASKTDAQVFPVFKVFQGGTGMSSTSPNCLIKSGSTAGGSLMSECNPTVGIITASSTTATSTFGGGITVDSPTFVVDYSLNKIGIGTTTIGQINGVQYGSVKLHISGTNTYSVFDTIGNGGILFNDSSESVDNRLWSFNTVLSGGTLSFATLTDAGSTSHQFVITRAGNVGAGTSTPQAKIEAYDDFTSKNAFTIYDNDLVKAQDESFGSILWKNTESSAPGSIGFGKLDLISNSNGSAANFVFKTADFNDVAFRDVMTITGGINGVAGTDSVGIGSTTPYSKLSVNADLSASGSSALYVQPTIAVGVQQASMSGTVLTANHVNNIGGDDVVDFKTVEIIPSIRTTTGAVTNMYGLYVGPGTSGSGLNIGAYIADRVGISTTTPQKILSIAGTAEVKAGTSSSTAQVGGRIFSTSTDAGNQTTVETDLIRMNVKSNTWGTNNDSVEGYAGGTFVSSGTATRQVKFVVAGTTCLDTGAISISTSAFWRLEFKVIRVSSTVLRCIATLNTSGASTAAYTGYVEVTALTMAADQLLKITGTAAGVGAATNDIVVKQGASDWKPAGNNN